MMRIAIKHHLPEELELLDSQQQAEQRLVRENGLVHARAAEDARRAGATRMVVPSVSSTKKSAYGGALEGSIAGKEAQGTRHRRET